MKIAILKHAYYPDLQGIERPEIDEQDFDTLEEAIEQIEEWNNETYYLEHNESGRPTYVVVDDVNADWIEGGRNGDGSNYDWDGAECECGECNKCCRMMIEQDRQYLLNNALYKN